MLKLNWHIVGHSKLKESLERDLSIEKMSHATLIEGPSQTGKFSLLKRVAQFMHCLDGGCLICNTCTQIENEAHIETFMFRNDGNKLGIKEFRELKSYLNLSPQGKYKIVIIQNIERLSIPLQNSMLKILEEPPKDVYFLLTTTNTENLLETITSRCRVHKSGLASNDEVSEFLEKSFKSINSAVKDEVLFFAAGRTGLAYELITNEEKYQNRINWLSEIKFLDQGDHEFEALKFAETLSEQERSVIFEFIQVLVQYLRMQMLSEETMDKSSKAAKIEKCQQTIDLIQQNVNVKMSLEVLFLHCFTRLGIITSQ
jgi:DNA polymerase-3 subunit delta'